MKFEEFDSRMRKYEENIDQFILQDLYLVVRLDGRSFTKLTKKMQFAKPFDNNFKGLMVDTTATLMKESGFNIIYGYTQSDEISLLLHPKDNTFKRKVRKINSTLASEASVAFSMNLGIPATFDCRVIPLPTVERVEDYFVWRQEDALRNALNAYCYWTLRDEGLSKRAASSELLKKGIAHKNELLFKRGINFNDVPTWQKRGIGLTFDIVEKDGFNAKENKPVTTFRREVRIEHTLPEGDNYRKFIRHILEIS